VFAYIHEYMYIRVCTYTHLYTYTYIYMTSRRNCVSMYAHMEEYKCVRIHVHVRSCKCVCIAMRARVIEGTWPYCYNLSQCIAVYMLGRASVYAQPY